MLHVTETALGAIFQPIEKVAHPDGITSNCEQPSNLGKSFASTSANASPRPNPLDKLEEVLDALSDWEDQLRDVNFDDLEPRP